MSGDGQAPEPAFLIVFVIPTIQNPKATTKRRQLGAPMLKPILAFGFALIFLLLLTGCADLQWVVEPGPEGVSPLVEAAGAATVALASNATIGPGGLVLGGVAAALAATAVILKRKAKR